MQLIEDIWKIVRQSITWNFTMMKISYVSPPSSIPYRPSLPFEAGYRTVGSVVPAHRDRKGCRKGLTNMERRPYLQRPQGGRLGQSLSWEVEDKGSASKVGHVHVRNAGSHEMQRV